VVDVAETPVGMEKRLNIVLFDFATNPACQSHSLVSYDWVISTSFERRYVALLVEDVEEKMPILKTTTFPVRKV
jgi:hypothetical protein